MASRHIALFPACGKFVARDLPLARGRDPAYGCGAKVRAQRKRRQSRRPGQSDT
jgi:hypothetical protein